MNSTILSEGMKYYLWFVNLDTVNHVYETFNRKTGEYVGSLYRILNYNTYWKVLLVEKYLKTSGKVTVYVQTFVECKFISVTKLN